MPSQQHMITTPDGVRLWAETFGDSSLPPLLLIMGAMNQGILWFDEFCTALAGKGYRVIRYDHRDTGASSVVNFTTQPYDLTDLTADVTHLLVALAGAPAHIVGLSMGGYIGQLLALDQPQRVRSLTLIATPADFRAAMTPAIVANPWELGQTLFDYGRQFQASLPWTPQELLATPVQHWRMLVGPHAPFDTARWQALQETVDRRTQNAVAAFNHVAAVTASPPWAERLPAIACPTLVIHGSADPCLPPVHGQQLAARIPGATLRTIPGMGHLFPPEWSETIADVIAGHLPSAAGGVVSPAAVARRIG